MPIKKIQIDNLHPANPITEIISRVNDNFDSVIQAIDNINNGVPVAGVTGAKGDTGQDGREGPQGIQGIQGERGLQGEPGPAGVQGPQGETGAQGIQGVAGRNGLPGMNGLDGSPGAQGIQGVAGTNGKDGAGLKGYAAGYVNAGSFVTLDNIKATVTTSGNRGLSVATVTGTMILSISATYSCTGGGNGHSTAWPGATYTTTPSGSWFGYHFPNAGDGSIYLCNDYNSGKVYRITLLIGAYYNNNFISIERMI